MGGVPLLSWLLSVRDQNLIDKLYRRSYRWARPLCFSFWFWDRVGQRFPHQSPVNAEFARDALYCAGSVLILPPNLFK
jgi:hypothetical protein